MQFVSPELPRAIAGWHSPRLGLEMPIVTYGHAGKPLLLLPTAAADFLENERFFLIKSIEEHVLAGKLRVFSIDSINKHAWMNPRVPVREQARRQALYAAYVEEEVVPYVRRAIGDESARLAIAGASFGAFHAANQFFRRPDMFETLFAMSGFYDLSTDYTGAYSDDNVYFNNPMSFVSNLHDEATLATLRERSSIHLLTGQGAYEAPDATRRFSAV